jgi:putative tricarboxylic transport membrane protein
MKDHPDVFWGVIGSFYLGNAMLLILNLPLVGIFAKIVRIAPKYLMPTVLVLCVIGAYRDKSNLFDVWVMLGAGVAGYMMRRYDYEPAPLVVGLVLGPVMERSFRQALIISRGSLSGLWDSPICIALWFVILVTAVMPFILPYLREKMRNLSSSAPAF